MKKIKKLQLNKGMSSISNQEMSYLRGGFSPMGTTPDDGGTPGDGVTPGVTPDPSEEGEGDGVTPGVTPKPFAFF